MSANGLTGLNYHAYVGDKHPDTLHVTACYIDMSLVVVHLVADIWSKRQVIKYLFLGISLTFHVSAKPGLCIPISFLTITCFIAEEQKSRICPR